MKHNETSGMNIIVPVMSLLVAFFGVISGFLIQRENNRAMLERTRLEITYGKQHDAYTKFMKHLLASFYSVADERNSLAQKKMETNIYEVEVILHGIEPFIDDKDKRNEMWNKFIEFRNFCDYVFNKISSTDRCDNSSCGCLPDKTPVPFVSPGHDSLSKDKKQKEYRNSAYQCFKNNYWEYFKDLFFENFHFSRTE